MYDIMYLCVFVCVGVYVRVCEQSTVALRTVHSRLTDNPHRIIVHPNHPRHKMI